MATQNLGDKILVTFFGELFNQRIMSTFWYGVSNLIGAPTVLAFSNALQTKISSVGGLEEAFLGCCPISYNLSQIWIQTVDPIRQVVTKYNRATGGAFAFDATTANSSAVILRRGDGANRKNISTLHVPLPNLDPGAVTGSLSGAMIAAMDALAVQVRSGLALTGTGGVFPIIRNGPGVADISPITAATTQTSIRTMRRRTLGLGI